VTVRFTATTLMLLCGCGADETTAVVAPPPACSDSAELLLADGTCVRPGVPADGCAAGFVHDGEYGCDPVLPPEPCPVGLMAVPGESECHPIMECGEGTWGEIPIEANTQYVDDSYTAGDSDGTAAKPWPTIQQGVSAAASGTMVAVAEGRYDESVVISGKSVRLWGRCPSLVEIVASTPPTALSITVGADLSEAHGVAISGPGTVYVSGAQQVLLDRIWVHDVTARGLNADSYFGSTHVTVRQSLFEKNHDLGLFIEAAGASLERSVVRGTTPSGGLGRGIHLQDDEIGAPASITVTGSLLEENAEVGLYLSGSDAVVSASLVRDTVPGTFRPDASGIAAEESGHSGMRATLSVDTSIIERTIGLGFTLSGSSTTIHRSIVRDTQSEATHIFGRGINIQQDSETGGAGELMLSESLVERNVSGGLFVLGSNATVERIVIRDTRPTPEGAGGRGVNLQYHVDTGAPAHATIKNSLITQNREYGVLLIGSDATIEATHIDANTANTAGALGDGLGALEGLIPGPSATATIRTVTILHSDRAALASIGGTITVETSHLLCAAFDLDGEPTATSPFAIADRGNNKCGCPAPDRACKLVSAGLTAPAPLPPAE